MVPSLSSLSALSCPPPLWNPHSAMEYGIRWFTGTREFQSVLLSPGLSEEKPVTKTQGLLGGVPPTAPPIPPPPPCKMEQ